MSPKHDEFLKRSAAFAKSLGAAAGTHAFIITGGHKIPIYGSVGGTGPGPLECMPQGDRLLQARRALKEAERRTRCQDEGFQAPQ